MRAVAVDIRDTARYFSFGNGPSTSDNIISENRMIAFRGV